MATPKKTVASDPSVDKAAAADFDESTPAEDVIAAIVASNAESTPPGIEMSAESIIQNTTNAVIERLGVTASATAPASKYSIREEYEAKWQAETEQIAKQLAEPFPKNMLKKHPTKNLTYIPIAEVIARMNRVLGVNGWHTEIVRVWREPDHPDWVLAHARVTATIGCVTVRRDGVGGQAVKKTKKDGSPVDLGDEYKGAMSDAIKKACQGFGVGLELARSEEALAFEAATYTDTTEAPASPANAMADAVSADTWAKFQTAMGTLTDDEKAAVKDWWARSGNAASGPPNPDISTEDQIVALLAEIGRIRLDQTQ